MYRTKLKTCCVHNYVMTVLFGLDTVKSVA